MKKRLFLLPLLLLSGGSKSGSPFKNPRVIALGEDHSPGALAAGDFDRDGKLDLIVGSDGSNDVILFVGDGRGGFRRAGSFAAGPSPAEIAAADFNRDGNLDLAIANHGVELVTILLGDGKGVFRPAPASPLHVRSRPHPHTIASCDVDGDGLLDLVIDSWGEKRFTLLKGAGDGSFATPGVSIEALRKPYRNVKLADLDGDGRCDLVAPNMVERAVTILKGDGKGGFHGEESLFPAGPSPFSVAVGDIDRDGKPDLAVANYSGHIADPSGDGLTFLLNVGRGRFRLGARIPTGRGSGDVAVGDVNGDGYADAVTANMGGDITVAFGGPGGFSAERSLTIPAGGRPQRVLLADFDGDRRADAVTANSASRSISIFLTR
ncbi:MAG TPA: VCBS repeat-containing protein [Thermoanaerobaculia bacterium]